jgi:hypothetical protein
MDMMRRRPFSGNTAAAGRVVLNTWISSHQHFLRQVMLPMLLALVPNPPVGRSLRWWLQKGVTYNKEGVVVLLDVVIVGMGACCFDSKYVHHWV